MGAFLQGLCKHLYIHLYSSFLSQNFVFFCFFFWLRWVFIAACGLSLVAASGGLLFVAVRGLRIAVASLVVEHGL